MSDPFVGQLSLVGFNFAPKGWAITAGQLLPISQNTALFSLLGTFYGGDGKSTFGLPNLQGCAAVGQGSGAGLSQYFIGETGGSQNVTLLASETPPHTHTLNGSTGSGQNSPQNNGWGNTTPNPMYFNTTTPNAQLSVNAVSIYGGSQPHNNMMPYQTLLWIIAMQGVFPSRG